MYRGGGGGCDNKSVLYAERKALALHLPLTFIAAVIAKWSLNGSSCILCCPGLVVVVVG